MHPLFPKASALTETIIAAAIEVHRDKGPGLIESIYEDWDDYEHTVVYGGPVFSYAGGQSWFVTVTPMFQLTDEEDEADFQVRAIAGYQF